MNAVISPETASSVLVTYTLFPDVFPRTKTERADVPWNELVERVSTAATYIDKAHCPLISLAEYGDARTDKECIRHAGNVRRIFGVELDYDGERVGLKEAAALLSAARIESCLYTSASHTVDRPRWRVLAPLADPSSPEQRAALVGRLNRILGGAASRESFTLSQSYYIGRVRGAAYETAVTHGRCIDEAFDLEPLYYTGQGGGGEVKRDLTTDAQLRDAFSRGEDRYQAMLKLSARWAARGMDEGDIASSLDALFGAGASVNGDGIDLRKRIPGIAASAAAKFGESRREPREAPPLGEVPPWVVEGDYEPERLEIASDAETDGSEPAADSRLIDKRMLWGELATLTPPERKWAIKGWLGLGHVTLISGPPGSGKTALCQAIASCLALGHDVIDEVPQPLKVLFWAGEDDRDELWRRQVAIAQWLGVPIERFQENLILLPLDQEDLTLVGSSRDGLVTTPALKQLREQVGDLGIDYVMLDSLARTYGGNENDRHEVTQFVAGLQWALSPTGAGCGVIGHPAKAAGSEFSGSTAWEASVRARWYFGFSPPDAKPNDDPVDPASPERYLAKRKTNYSTRDWRKVLYANGVMTVQTLEPGQNFAARRSKQFLADEVVHLLRRLERMGLQASASAQAQSYLPRVAKSAGLMTDGMGERDIRDGLAEALSTGRVKNGVVGQYSNRSPKMGLVIVETGVA